MKPNRILVRVFKDTPDGLHETLLYGSKFPSIDLDKAYIHAYKLAHRLYSSVDGFYKIEVDIPGKPSNFIQALLNKESKDIVQLSTYNIFTTSKFYSLKKNKSYSRSDMTTVKALNLVLANKVALDKVYESYVNDMNLLSITIDEPVFENVTGLVDLREEEYDPEDDEWND